MRSFSSTTSLNASATLPVSPVHSSGRRTLLSPCFSAERAASSAIISFLDTTVDSTVSMIPVSAIRRRGPVAGEDPVRDHARVMKRANKSPLPCVCSGGGRGPAASVGLSRQGAGIVHYMPWSRQGPGDGGAPGGREKCPAIQEFGEGMRRRRTIPTRKSDAAFTAIRHVPVQRFVNACAHAGCAAALPAVFAASSARAPTIISVSQLMRSAV